MTAIEVTVGARRDLAQRAAFETLAAAGDPVAQAIAAAVRSASTVEMSEALVARTKTLFENTGQFLPSDALFDVMVAAFQAAGFEVTT